MIVEAREQFELPAPADPAAALAFLRGPDRSLARVRFLRELKVNGQEVRGVMAVQLPMLGEVTLPFFSVLEETELGARLVAQPLEGERAWIEVEGEGQLQPTAASGAVLAYVFVFRTHLRLPTAEKWGGGAFEKMVKAAASRTIERVARELPRAMGEALAESGS